MKINYSNFEEAREYIRRLELKSFEAWKLYCKTEKPKNIPSYPNYVYKDKWISFPDWMGYDYDVSKLNKSGLANKKYNINTDFFKTWSHDMAYIFGFWFADGCISNGGFSISQHKNDKYILEKILKIMGSNHPIYKNKNNVLYFCIKSKEIVKDIRLLGGIERKSLNVKFPIIPKEYLSDFIRGYFDGDGCVYFMKNRKGYLSNFATGSEKFAYGLLKAIKENANIKGSICKSVKKKGSKTASGFLSKDSIIYSIRYSYNSTRRLRDFMYKNDGIKLIRKYDLLKKAGNIKIIKSDFLSYKEALGIVHKLKLNSQNDWENNYCAKGLRPFNIPYAPNVTYKNKGWVSWKEWLGYEINACKNERIFLVYIDAIRFVHKLKLKSKKEWEKYCKEVPKPLNIPYCPDRNYKNQGWVSWKEWLGYNKIIRIRGE